MKFVSGISIILILLLFTARSHEQVTSVSTSTSRNTFSSSTIGKECVLSSRAMLDNFRQFSNNSSDTCFTGNSSDICKTWRMTNAIILKCANDLNDNCFSILEFINKTTTLCNSDDMIQFLYPNWESEYSFCNAMYNFNINPLKKVFAHFDCNKTLINDVDQPGLAMFIFLDNIISCLQKANIATDGSLLNIFTDMTYIDLCENNTFMGAIQSVLAQIIQMGYIIKFYFVDQNLQYTQKNVEAVLKGCQFGNSKSFCEIADMNSMSTNYEDFQVCFNSNPIENDKKEINWQLLLIIGIPSVSITICCIAFFVCCLKCARLKMKMMRMRIFSNNSYNPEQLQLRKNWQGKRKRFSTDLGHANNKELSQRELPHFATANQYTDIEVLASSSIKDIWEIDTKNILIQEDHFLGKGAFANVYKAVVKGKIPLYVINNSLSMTVESESDDNFEVAVKKLPVHATNKHLLDFFHEINFMKHLGHHPHVIAMLGCVSHPYDPMIIVEYCARGDLLKFLRKHRDFVLMDKSDDCPIEADMCLRIKDLISIAWQAADGMSYIASKQFVHRDVAARNVLLTRSLTAKISDFGLCRYMDSLLYTSKGGRLPIKWMSIEALKLHEFSSKSDVWSFGVLLFEIFSMGDVPYPTIQQADMLDYLLSGERLPQSLKCPNEIYDLMNRCFAENPNDRPDFEKIKEEISEMLNLDDESYGYLMVGADDKPKFKALTMQDSKETAPCTSVAGSEEFDEDGEYYSGSEACHNLDQVLAEKFGMETKEEIKQIFCEITAKSKRSKRRQENEGISSHQT